MPSTNRSRAFPIPSNWPMKRCFFVHRVWPLVQAAVGGLLLLTALRREPGSNIYRDLDE